MKKNLFLWMFFGFLYTNVAFAQKQTYNWYFGNKIGLNFGTSPPQPLTNSVMSSVEGSASISDANGNLLFYTNGISIINKEHTVMRNGTGLLGDLSSTNNVVIVPLPGSSDSIYYIFTVGAAGQHEKGLRYSVVNMRLQNGLGEVIEKNKMLLANCFEKLAAVRHCNGKDVFVSVRIWNTDSYATFLVTPAGVGNFPIQSSSGLIVGGYDNNSLGTLKFSGDGKKAVALHAFQNDSVEVMDFDNLTGEMANFIRFKPNDLIVGPAFSGVYGAEFSPDGRLLYVGSNNGAAEASVLYQFDLTSMQATDIMASRQIISVNSPWYAGALQAAPDGKIYYALRKDTSLSVIHNPNATGAACNFVYNELRMVGPGEPIQAGLPTFIAGDLDSLRAPFDFSRSGSCTSLAVQFQLNRINTVDSVHWYFGDGTESLTLSPLHTYSAAGEFLVRVKIFKNDCGAPVETIEHSIFVAETGAQILNADTGVCEKQNMLLSSLTSATTYLWNTGQTSRSINIQNPGLYWLEILKDGCIIRDTFNLILKQPASVSLGSDTTVCLDKPATLTAGNAGNFLWSTGETTANITIRQPGSYWLHFTNTDGCTASDTLIAAWGDCPVYLPNAFSPNGDGINESFGLITGMSTSIFRFSIYNRYGQVIFSSTDPHARWDGKLQGKPVPVGGYPWMMTYKNKEGFIQTDKGIVMLIR